MRLDQLCVFWIGMILINNVLAITKPLPTVMKPLPPDTNCKLIKWCDKYNICSNVCERGTLFIDPWLDYAIRQQINLAYNESLCNMQLIGSHNSAITLADGYGNQDAFFEQMIEFIHWIDKNSRVQTNDQYFSLTDQLNLGLRMVELDTHWFNNDLHIAHCGGVHSQPVNDLFKEINKIAKQFGYNVTWDTETLGCSPSLSAIPADEQRTLASAFDEIRQWMLKPANKDQFLMIFFDDQMDLLEWGVVDNLLDLIHKYFDDIGIFTPVDKKKYSPNKWISANEIMKLKKRILFLSGADFGVAMSSTVFAKYGPDLCNWNEPNYRNFSSFPDCHIDRVKANVGQILRMPTSELQYGPFNSDFHIGKNEGVLTPENLPPIIECNINFPSPDLLGPSKVEAMVWSWAKDYPFRNVTERQCTALLESLGRWITFPCDEHFSHSCRNNINENDWKLGSQSTFDKPICPPGYSFVPPLNAYQNSVIKSILVGKSVAWINVLVK